jgi:hypothetical protein
MKRENPEVLFQNHYKIYVLFKDKIIFESELENQQIEYYCDIQNQPNFENGIRYFINDYDRVKIDEIFIKNGIIANTETINVFDYRDNKKIISIYLVISGIVVLIMILMSLL